MTFAEIFLLAVALSLDSCAVAFGSSAAGRLNGRRSAFRLSFHFGLFQFLMPVAGWGIGNRIQPYIAPFDHWVAFSLLAIVAIRMIRPPSESPSPEEIASDPSRGWMLVTLAFATSIDALAVGISLAALRISAWYPSVVIGLTTMILSISAIAGGLRVGKCLGRWAQPVGGVVLLLIGVKIVVSDLR